MPTTPVISVIVPVYKAERYLNECIDSILAQTFSDFELILVDDESPDRSGEICDQYAAKDTRIRVIHKPNGGVSSARNAGLDTAKGEWIAFVDADDMIAPDMLEQLFNKAEQENADIVTCDFNFLYPDGHTITEHQYHWNHYSCESIADFLLTIRIVVWGCLIKQNALGDIRFFDNITFTEDFHFIIRAIYNASKITSINTPLYIYRQHAYSACSNYTEKSLQEQLYTLDLIEKFFTNNKVLNPNIFRNLNYRRLATCKFMLLESNLHKTYINLNFKAKEQILDCPFYNKKQKIIAWCLTHHLKTIAFTIVKLRKVCGR